MGNLPTTIGFAPDGQVASFYNRITRRHVTIAAFILLGLLSLSLLITAVVQGHNRGKPDNTNTNTTKNEFCLTQGCISSATYQLRSIDRTASSNLCTDFYQYACGGWQQTHPIQSYDVERTVLNDIIDRRDAEIERLLDAPISQTSDRGWEYKLKTYYSECIDDYSRQPDSAKYMIGLMQDRDTVNGWFLFDNSAENASQEFLLNNQSVYTQISHIHGDLGVTAIFGIRARFDEMNPNVKRLEFYPAGLSMEVNDYLGNDSISEGNVSTGSLLRRGDTQPFEYNERRAAFQLYIIDVVGIIAQDAGISDTNLNDRAFTIANDVFTVEYFLAESLRRNPTESKPSITNLQDMSAQLSFDFNALMGHELSNPSFISPLTPVYFTNLMYFTDVFEYLDKNDDPLFARMIHNYFRWRLLSTYIDDLSYNYVHAHRVYLNAYYAYALHASNEVYCTREVIRRFPLAIQRLYTMNSTRSSNASTTVQNIFQALKDGLKQYINDNAAWMPDEATKTIARNKIDALTAAIGYAKIASDDTLLNNYYEKFQVSDESHFLNAYYYQRFHRWSLSASLENPSILDHWDLFESRPSRLFDYIAVFNQLFVIASGLHEPLVSAQWPWSVNMGSIGVLLAQKLFASIDGPEGRTHLANGTRFDWWAPATVQGYNNSRNCITDYYVRDLQTITYYINGAQILVRLTGEPFSPTTLRHIGALRFAYGALLKTDQMKTLRMPGTNYTSEQTFFLSYAQTQCYQRQGLLQVVRTQLGFYDERTALNAALIQMPEFARAFQCPERLNTCFNK